MNRLALCALQESYSVKFGCSAERIGVTGGHDRYIKSTNTKKHLVQVSFVLREDDYLYFRAFYQNWQLNPLPFLMKLIIEDDEYKDYIAQFVKNSCQFDELEGDIFKVSAQVSVFISPVIALTSRPYPIYFEERVGASFGVMNSTFNSALNVNENISTSFGVVGVVTQNVRTEMTLDNEKISTSFGVAGVVAQNVRTETALGNENISTSFGVIGAQQMKILISHTAEIEKISTNFALMAVQIIN